MGFDNYYFLKEAGQVHEIEHSMLPIKSAMEKAIGGKLYQQFGIDYFKNSLGTGEGIRYYLPDSSSVRFNFENKEITSIDIWHIDSKDAKVRIDTKGIPILEIIPLIVDQINNPRIGKFEINLGQSSVKKETLDLNNPKVDVKTGSKKEINNDPDISKDEQKLNKVKFADPKFVYKDLELYIRWIAEGKQYSLLITGMPGMGKTYITKKILSEYGSENEFFVIKSGFTTPKELYRNIFENNGKIIVYDDCDSAFSDKKSLGILKSALDNKKERIVTWAAQGGFDLEGMAYRRIRANLLNEKVPKSFNFTGRIIFISNLQKDKIDKTLLSRSLHEDLTLKSEDIILRIRQIMADIQPEIDMKYKEQLIDFMEQNKDKVEVDIRSFDKAIAIVASGNPEWKRLVMNQIAL